MHRRNAGADGECLDAFDARRFGIHALQRIALLDTAAQPDSVQPIEDLRSAVQRQVQHQPALFVVQTAGGILLSLLGAWRHLLPGPIAGHHLPHPGRILAADAHRFSRFAGEVQLKNMPAQIISRIKTEVEGVARARRGLIEGVKHLQPQARQMILVEFAFLAHMRQQRWDNEQVAVGGEGDGLVGLLRANLLPGWDRNRLRVVRRQRQRNRQPEGQLGARAGRRLALQAKQLQEFDVIHLRHTVESKDHQFGHPGEQLNEGDARVTEVIVRPLRAVMDDALARFIHQVALETEVVQVGCR